MFTAQDMYGLQPQAPAYATGGYSHTQTMMTTDIPDGVRGLLHPNNPLMWFGVILLVTVGAAGVAGSVRLGQAKLSASLDKG